MVAFALIGLIMAVLIVGNVVSGAVVAGYHRIGVLKSLGLTPAQVVVAYLSRVGWPALAGCLAGVVAGNLLAAPVLHDSAGVYGVGSQQVPWWASAVAPAGMLVLTMLAALGPALRAGRLSAVQAIAAGRAPRRPRVRRAPAGRAAAPAAPGRPRPRRAVRPAGPYGRDAGGRRVRGHRGDLRLRAELVAEPGRAGPDALGHRAGADSAVRPRRRPEQVPDAAQDAAVTAALSRQPGMLHDVALYRTGVKVPGVSGNVNAQAFGGDASWVGYGLIAGHWYSAPGEVDVNTAFLTQGGLAVGDTVTVNTGATQVSARIAGEVFDPSGISPRSSGARRRYPASPPPRTCRSTTSDCGRAPAPALTSRR